MSELVFEKRTIQRRMLELITRTGWSRVEVRVHPDESAQVEDSVPVIGALVATISVIDAAAVGLRTMPIERALWADVTWRHELKEAAVDFWRRVNATNGGRGNDAG